MRLINDIDLMIYNYLDMQLFIALLYSYACRMERRL